MGEKTLKLKMLLLYFPHVCDWYREVWKRDWSERMCCSGYECGCYGSDWASWWEHCWANRMRWRP